MWLRAVAGLAVVCGMAAVAQEKGYWRAENSTAKSITGDVALSDEKMSINFVSFTVARIRGLEKDEASALFDGDAGAAGSGSLYRLSIPASRTFLRKNTLCGSEDTQWMVTYVSGRALQLVFFSGQKPPVFAADAIANSTDLCGRFGYVR
ncbi:MAG TPA: hypothetical protein VHW70_12115 [Edaphobacter sp.]|nr:hypothetical protein [Edaphobacter sp.]